MRTVRFLVGLRPLLNISLDRVQADLRALDQHEEPLRPQRRRKRPFARRSFAGSARPRANEKALQQEAARREQARQQEAARREQARLTSIRAKGWSKTVEDAVVQRKIFLGMTADQVREAWGPPQQINKTLTRYGEHEQWVYGLGQYLYFENGHLSSIQTSETPRR